VESFDGKLRDERVLPSTGLGTRWGWPADSSSPQIAVMFEWSSEASQRRLALESGEPLGIGRERRPRHLDRDIAAEPRVTRAVNLSHFALADRRDDLAGTDARADHGDLSASRSATRQSLTTTRSGPTFEPRLRLTRKR